jgi:hypothetical protein
MASDHVADLDEIGAVEPSLILVLPIEGEAILLNSCRTPEDDERLLDWLHARPDLHLVALVASVLLGDRRT